MRLRRRDKYQVGPDLEWIAAVVAALILVCLLGFLIWTTLPFQD
jgi:hypothetical protein